MPILSVAKNLQIATPYGFAMTDQSQSFSETPLRYSLVSLSVMKEEIKFQKYDTKRPGYHWKLISKSIWRRNIFVMGRYEVILNLIGKEIRNKMVLDVGCGDGVLSYLLAKRGANVVGIDTSQDAIGFANKKCKKVSGNLKFIAASTYALPFKDRGFDYVLSPEVIEHLEYPDEMAAEIKRVWNGKEKVVISTPIKFGERSWDKMHFQEFSESGFKKLLERYFENVTIINSHPLFWLEFQNKVIFHHHFPRYFLNFLNLFFRFNPFNATNGWKYYALQIAIISR